VASVSSVPSFPDLRARALGVVRRGPRTVLWTEPHLGLGNFLYHWLQVSKLRESGQEVVALRIGEMEPWLPYFPEIDRDYTITRDEVRLNDRREPGFFQGWGVNYWPEHVERFVDFALRQTTLPVRPDPDTERVVVNVRRGDYFGASFARRYAFDHEAYLHVALDRASRVGAPVRRIHVVSDDIAWCRTALTWLGDNAEVTFAAAGPTPADDFATLAGARRLILTNSTFGYWAAHFSNGLYGDNHQDVVAPWFHDRTMWSGASYQLNPAWTVVRDIPGGWVAPSMSG
jgi:hypothetical protein